MLRHCVRTRWAAAASVLVLAACGGGGGGGGSAPATTIISTPAGDTVTTNFTPGTLAAGSSDQNNFGAFTTGSATITPASGFAVKAPAAATVGNNTTPPPTGNQTLTGAAFPLKQSVINITSSGVSPDTAANTGGATLSVVNWNAGGDSQFRLTIPGLGVDTTFTSASLLKGPSTVAGGTFRLTSSNINFALLGVWEVDTKSSTDNTVHLSAFTTGFETPVSGLPTTGTASYTGTQNVAGLISTTVLGGVMASGAVLGDGSFSANFSTGAVTGTFTNMMVSAGTGIIQPVPWNNVSVTSSLAAGTSHFSGTTAATSAPGNPFSLSGTATGRIDGGFYGPAANELGAVWSLTDSTTTVIGVAHGSKP